jgi:uncharacterized membrane protein
MIGVINKPIRTRRAATLAACAFLALGAMVSPAAAQHGGGGHGGGGGGHAGGGAARGGYGGRGGPSGYGGGRGGWGGGYYGEPALIYGDPYGCGPPLIWSPYQNACGPYY